MSTQQLQSAIISLVRYPDLNRAEKIEEFLCGYDLTESERWQVRSLAISPYVSRFGQEQRIKRFNNYVRPAMPVATKLMGKSVAIDEIFCRRFEPAHPWMPVDSLAAAFHDFFLASLDTLRRELSLPEFLGDMVRYEFAEYAVVTYHLEAKWRISPRSLLQPGAIFQIVELDHDLAAYVDAGRDLEREELLKLARPQRRQTLMLFVRSPKGDGSGTSLLSQFEIDDELRVFLQSQLLDEIGAGIGPPACYGDLVELGLCKPVQS